MSAECDAGSLHPTQTPYASVLTPGLEAQDESVASVSRLQRICEALNLFSSRTSLNGLIYIQSSGDFKMKLFWIFVFLSAVTALTFHSYSTVQDYLAYETKVVLEQVMMKSLNLPALTVCNHNPIRFSKKTLLSDELQYVIDKARIKADNFAAWTGMSSLGNTNTETIYNQAKLLNYLYNEQKILQSNITFKDRYSVQQAGHQMQDMVLWCLVSGKRCGNIKVKPHHSRKYNNCYTLDTSVFRQIITGVEAGLEFALYLEPDEYLPGISDTKGIHLQVHPNKSYIYPEFDGIALTPGMMTYMALTADNITRLGKPYSSCVETDEYIDKYGFAYNIDLCIDVCYLQHYITNCGCYDSDWMNVVTNPNNVTVCDDSFNCEKHNKLFRPDICSCEKPCRETVYRSKVSTALWPSYSQGKILVDYLCARDNFSPEKCQKLRSQNEAELRENFVGIRIYYETMFSTQLSDVAEINMATFLSNLGGCVGLWIGVSVLSIVELLHLFADIIWRILPRVLQNKII